MKIRYILILAFIVLSCSSKKDPVPVQLLTNTDVENGMVAPSDWFKYDPGTGNFSFSWATDQASSPTHSLKIIAGGADATNFAYWVQEYNGTIPVGKDVTLSVKIKSSLVGNGASIAIGGYDTSVIPTAFKQFIDTKGVTTITGDQDWTNYTVKLTAVGTSITVIHVFLVLLSNTTGTVYFDDITLTYNN